LTHAAKLTFCLCFFLSSRAYAVSWHFLYNQDDIQVFSDLQDPPRFKAEGTIEADVLELLAVLSDVARRPEWVRGLNIAVVIAGDPEDKVLIYSRYSLPWPAADRDSLIESVISKDLSNGELSIAFKAIEDDRMKPVGGVVRVPIADGLIVLKKTSEQKVFIKYEMRTDPGGNLPKWITRYFSKDAPINTLTALRQQIIRTKGQYQEFIDRNSQLEFFQRLK